MGFPPEGQARQVKQAGYPLARIISVALAHRGCVYLSSPWFWVVRAGGWCLPECETTEA